MTFLPVFDTPDTTFYVILGYIVFIGLPILFILSLIYRSRALKRDEEMLKSLKEEEQEKKK